MYDIGIVILFVCVCVYNLLDVDVPFFSVTANLLKMIFNRFYDIFIDSMVKIIGASITEPVIPFFEADEE